MVGGGYVDPAGPQTRVEKHSPTGPKSLQDYWDVFVGRLCNIVTGKLQVLD